MLKEIFEIINIFSASLPYYFQIKKFQETNSSEGYSLKVTLLILLSSILRIYFWFGKFFHWSLLLQSVLLILIHLWLLYEAVKFKNLKLISDYLRGNLEEYKDQIVNKESDLLVLKSKIESLKLITKLNNKETIFCKSNFFNWNSLHLYALVLMVFIFIVTDITCYFTYSNSFYVEFLGVLQSIVEGSMSIPQLLEIIKTKNVENISVALIASWFFGDLLKTYYFIISASPLQFILLGITQVSLNCLIVYFYIKFRK